MDFKQIRIGRGPVGIFSLLVAIAMTGATLARAASDLTITYAYDQRGNRKSETGATATAPSDGTTPLSLSVSPLTVTDTIAVSKTGTSTNTKASDISATASGGTGPYLFQWVKSQGYSFNLATGSASVVTGTAPDVAVLTSSCAAATACTLTGTWTVNVTDQNGYVAQTSVTITHNYVASLP